MPSLRLPLLSRSLLTTLPAALALLGLVLLLAVTGQLPTSPAPVQAQTQPGVLVSNFNQNPLTYATSTYNTNTSQEFTVATQFTTGSGASSGAYNLSSVEVRSYSDSATSTDGVLRAELWSAATTTANNPPAAKLYDLTVPATVPGGGNEVTFTAPSHATLATETSYYLVVYTTDSTDFKMMQTMADGEDGVSAAGWSIENDGAHSVVAGSPDGGSWVWNQYEETALIQVRGSEATTAVAVSNFGQTVLTGFGEATSTIGAFDSSQQYVVSTQFTTGSGTNTLSSISVKTPAGQATSTDGVLKAELWSAGTDTGNPPDAKLYDLTVPDVSGGAQTVTFTAPPNATLAENAKHYLVVFTSDNTKFTMQVTNSDSEDAGAAAGWSIADGGPWRKAASTPDAGNWAQDTHDQYGDTALIQVSVYEAGEGSADPLALSALTAESSADGSNFSALTLAPDFDAATTGYWATVGNGVTHVRLTPTLADTSSSLAVGKTGALNTVVSGSASDAIPLEVGDNDIFVEVTDTNFYVRSFTVRVRRAASNLLVSNAGQPDAEFGYLTDQWSVAQAFTTGAASALRGIDIEAANTNITEAERDTIRAELWSADTNGAPDSKLADLTVPAHPISTGTVSFAAPANTTLAASTTYYAVFYTVGSFGLLLEATPSDSEDAGSATGWSIASGARNAEVDEPTSSSSWSAEKTDSVRIAVNEASPTDLSTLAVETSTDGSSFAAVTGAATLAPAFTAGATGYRATVGNDTTHVRLTPTVAVAGSTVEVGKASSLTTVASGSPSDAIPMEVGDNEITVRVTDTNSNTRDYTVTVGRVPSGSEWWATLTPEHSSAHSTVGCGAGGAIGCDSALTDNEFTIGDANRFVRLGFFVETNWFQVDVANPPHAELQALKFCVGSTAFSIASFEGIIAETSALGWTAGTPVSLSIGTSCTEEAPTPTPAAEPGPGDLDPEFSSASSITTAIGSAGDRGYAVARQDDGKIVVAGYSYNGSDRDFAVVRYTADGVPDTTFGTGGVVTTDFNSNNDEAYAVAVQGDGKIVVAGEAGNGSNRDFAVARYTSAGALDTTFGEDGDDADTLPDGYATTTFGVGNDRARALAIHDGKIVVAGYADITGQGTNFALARYTSAGALDTDFDTDGKVDTQFGSTNTDNQEAWSVAIQSDGKIVAAGHGVSSSNKSFLVARYTTAGALDASFDLDGSRSFSVTSANDAAYGVAIQSDGKIVLAGESDDDSDSDIALVRLTAEGSTDDSFGSFSSVRTPIGSAGDRGRAVRIDADGKIVVAGYTYNGSNTDFVVARYDADGSLDTGFGGDADDDGTLDGFATMAIGTGNDEAYAVALDSGGTILAAGYSNNGSNDDFALAAFTADGEPAAVLDGPGWLTTAIGSESDQAHAVAIQPDGKIVVAGYSFSGSYRDFAVARYDADGSLDTDFDSDGIATTSIGSFDDEADAMAVQSDGKIVAAGKSNNGSVWDFALVRYDTDGSLDTGFGTTSSGIVTTGIGSGDSQAKAVAIQSDGKIVVAGISNNGSDDDVALARYNTDGSPDTGFGTTNSGTVTTDFNSNTDQADAMAVQPDGKIVVAGISNNGSDDDFALARYNANGTLDTGFGTSGKVTTAIGSGLDVARAVAIQLDGKIVAAGYFVTDEGSIKIAVVRYNANGTLDTGFGTGGKVTTAIGSVSSTIYSIVIQADGKIVAAGYSHNGSGSDFTLVRYATDGSLDTGFGTTSSGIVTTGIGSGEDRALAVAIQSDNNIVVAGLSHNVSNDDFAVARYLAGEVGPFNIKSAALNDLTAESSADGSAFTALTLSPAFYVGTAAYTAVVAEEVTHVRLTPTLLDGDATVQVGKSGNLATVSDGTASGAIALDFGDNDIIVEVTASDGTSGEYTVNVRRRDVWSATLTPGTYTGGGGGFGCAGQSECDSQLSDNDFTVGGTSYAFRDVRDANTNALIVYFIPDPEADLQALKFCIGETAYSIGSGSPHASASTDVGWADGVPVDLSVGTSCPPDTPSVQLSASPNPVDEGSSVTVTATLSKALSANVTIPLTLTAGTAESGDYGTLANITISSGQTTGTGTISANHDTDADDETFTVELGALPSEVGAGSPSSVLVTITDDEKPTVSLSASPNPVTEGSAVTITATLAASLSSDVAVPLTLTAGTADTGDYGTLASITVSAGQTTGTGTISANQDTDEDDETFTVSLDTANLPSSVLEGSPNSVLVTIADDEGIPSVSLSASPNPVDEGSSVTVTATLSKTLTSSVTVPLTLTAGTAESGDHGTLASITVSSGATTATGAIRTNQDRDTDDETFTVSLGTLPSEVRAGSASSVEVTIADDDKAEVSLEASPNPVDEGNAVTITARLSKALPETVTIPIGLGAFSAEDGDYGTLESITVVAGRTSGTGTITTVRDEDEDDDGFTVVVTDPLPSSLLRGTPFYVDITIRDDGPLRLELAASALRPGEGGTVTLTATLNHPAPVGGARVRFGADGRGDSPASPLGDFTLEPAGEGQHDSEWMVIAEGERRATATLRVVNDTEPEDDETLVVWVRGAWTAEVPELELTIPANDGGGSGPAAWIDAEPNPVDEGRDVTVRVRLTEALGAEATIPLTLSRGTAEAGDYGTLASITIAAGATVGTGVIATVRDADGEDETFTVRLGRMPTGARAGTASSVVVTIDDLDGPRAWLEVEPNPVAEGSQITVTAKLEEALSRSVTIPLTVSPGTSESGDHGVLTSIVIASGRTEGSGRIATRRDTDGDDETFTVSLGASLPSGVRAGHPESVEVVIADEGAAGPAAGVSLSASPNPVPEGESVTVTATLTEALTRSVTIPVTVSAGTSESGDHGSLAGIRIASGATSGTGAISTRADSDTGDETFTVSLGSRLPSGILASSPSSVTVTIADSGGDAPGRVRSLRVSAGDGRLDLAWSAPSSGTVTAYETQYRERGASGWTTLYESDYSDTAAAIVGLVNGTRYEVRVRASNDHGEGAWATSSGAPASGNNNSNGLRGLSVRVSDSPDGAYRALSLRPSFSSSVTAYTATAPAGTTHARVRVSASSPTALILVDGHEVASGSESPAVHVSSGAPVWIAVIPADNGEAKEYSVTITIP